MPPHALPDLLCPMADESDIDAAFARTQKIGNAINALARVEAALVPNAYPAPDLGEFIDSLLDGNPE